MSIMKNRMLAAAVFSAALFFINGCILNPKTEPPDPLPPVEWPDLSDKEDVIETISLCYEYYHTETLADLEAHYRDILYDGDNKYIFKLQSTDFNPGENNFLTLEEDVRGSVYVWDKSSSLNLDLSSGTWAPAGLPDCDDCLATTRTYTITTSIDHNGEILDLSGENMTVQFIVRRQHDDPGKWAIYIAYDRDPT